MIKETSTDTLTIAPHVSTRRRTVVAGSPPCPTAAHEARDYRRSLERAAKSRTCADRPREFSFRGRRWELMADVFAPTDSPSTGVALELLGIGADWQPPCTGPFLEMGCGAGVISVLAALSGAGQVYSCDINPAAVENTWRNAVHADVEDRVHVMQSDLFAALPPGKRFGQIFFSSNYVQAPAGFRYRTMHERAYVDAGYAVHRRYIAEAPRRLAPGGRALLHFSSRGDLDALHRIAEETGSRLRVVRRIRVPERTLDIEHQLIEITAVGG
ncbi:methyltransferase [Streptomyces katsurahamanus]|uniref:Methyltransferase n=1 Tax=Streptomyces katsurahamanus TaxID=2577098 RepID=A0ABW9P1L6_9ACTN|nr:methyltransferase [Streptomyces katsurahamanus]MQS39214.1 methyltransferase [Streptomyces katsurahamanus]